MLIRKKYVVQKSFRVDQQVERDLGILARLTERSQNDLVNVAIMELLQDNKYYFLNVAILEHFERQIEDAQEELEPFEMGGLRVEIKYTDDGVEVRNILSGNEGIVEDYTRIFESDISDEFEEYLISLGIRIDSSAEDTLKYLADRTDYRDYVKIRK